MGANTEIVWCDHTFNPWLGCTKISPGCANCYADEIDRRRYSKTMDGGTKEAPVRHFGLGAPRHRTSEANWKQPIKWNRDAAIALGIEPATLNWRPSKMHVAITRRPRVFCSSLADWLDEEVSTELRAELLFLIYCTPNLDWLLLSKRVHLFREHIQNILEDGGDALGHLIGYADDTTAFGDWLADWIGGQPPTNVWIGTTVEDQTRADQRVPELVSIPARVRFLSCEPLLGPVNLSMRTDRMEMVPGVHWVICGGESGPKARPMHPEWARSLRDQCTAAGVPFLFKQWGEWATDAKMPDGKLKLDTGRIMANDGTLYVPTDIAPCGSRVGDAMRAGHDKASLTFVYRVGKKAAGRLLDGIEWNQFPEVSS